MSNLSTRETIIDKADQLFYQQGYAKTSFADIAKAVSISRGNFYYHFKTKDQILEAVIDARMAKTRQMLEDWEAEGKHPLERICSFIHILIANQSLIRQFGCPVGSLTVELAKLNHEALEGANDIFGLFRDWLTEQFTALGREEDADRLALHLLGRSQGVAVMMNSIQDEAFTRQEVEEMCAWAERQTSSPNRH